MASVFDDVQIEYRAVAVGQRADQLEESLRRQAVSIPFGASPDAKKGTITGNFITWGHHEENAKPHQLVIYVWMKGDTRGWYFIHDVTDHDGHFSFCSNPQKSRTTSSALFARYWHSRAVGI